jgi:hypothetical protein
VLFLRYLLANFELFGTSNLTAKFARKYLKMLAKAVQRLHIVKNKRTNFYFSRQNSAKKLPTTKNG